MQSEIIRSTGCTLLGARSSSSSITCFFWCPACLPALVKCCLWLQHDRLEDLWTQSAATLLLRSAQDERGYETPIFDTELAECKFAEYPIDTWSKATLAAAPLFSASWQVSRSRKYLKRLVHALVAKDM